MQHNPSKEIRPEARRFRKRPIVVTAYQTIESRIIQTLEGPMRAESGDWIITGVAGEQYPCKPDIFAATYEPVQGETG